MPNNIGLNAGVNSAVQFLNAYLTASEQRKEKEKQEKARQKLEQSINQPGTVVTRGPEGSLKVRYLTQQEIEQGKAELNARRLQNQKLALENSQLKDEIENPKPKVPFTQAKIQQTLGVLKSGGGRTIYNQVFKFRTRQDAINYVTRQLGPQWQLYAPQAVDIINTQFPENNTQNNNSNSIAGSSNKWWLD